MVKPYATVEGTAAYLDRFVDRLDAEHFGSLDGLTVSSIGLGTYLGDSNDEADEAYLQAIREALRLGCNAFDAAINYRCQRSERVIGRALKEAIAAGEVSRQEVVVATKGGFVPFDGSPPSDPGAYFFETFVETGLCEQSDLVAGCHVMTPGYLADQIERSLENMELECIDLYYIHNPETQLSVVDRETYEERLRGAFTALEEAVAAGKIRRYGAATWAGFRLEPGTSEHLSLEDMVAAAQDVGGEDHHFRAIQLPYNLAMPEAFFKKNSGGRGQPNLACGGRQGLWSGHYRQREPAPGSARHQPAAWCRRRFFRPCLRRSTGHPVRPLDTGHLRRFGGHGLGVPRPREP